MDCELCGDVITGQPAVVIDGEGSHYYCFEEPRDKSCYINYLVETDQEWLLDMIHSELD